MSVTKEYLNTLAPRLSERDYEIVATVGRFKLATSQALEKLHFSDCSPRSRARSRQFVLKRLTEKKILKRIGERPVGGDGGGSTGYLYALDKAGLSIAALTSDTPRRKYVEFKPHMAHTLAVLDNYVRLVEADRNGELRLLAYDTEPYCWRTFEGQTLKPDAFVRIGTVRDGKKVAASFFIEVDRNQEWGTKIESKVPTYLSYKAHDNASRAFPRVLFLAPTAQRVNYLGRLLRAQAGPDAHLFIAGLVDDFESLLLA